MASQFAINTISKYMDSYKTNNGIKNLTDEINPGRIDSYHAILIGSNRREKILDRIETLKQSLKMDDRMGVAERQYFYSLIKDFGETYLTKNKTNKRISEAYKNKIRDSIGGIDDKIKQYNTKPSGGSNRGDDSKAKYSISDDGLEDAVGREQTIHPSGAIVSSDTNPIYKLAFEGYSNLRKTTTPAYSNKSSVLNRIGGGFVKTLVGICTVAITAVAVYTWGLYTSCKDDQIRANLKHERDRSAYEQTIKDKDGLYNKSVNDFNNALKQKNINIAELNKKAKEYQNKIKEFNINNNNLTKEKDKLDNENNQLRMDNDRLSQRLDTETAENKTLTKEKEALEKEKSDLEGKLKQSEKETEKLNDALKAEKEAEAIKGLVDCNGGNYINDIQPQQ